MFSSTSADRPPTRQNTTPATSHRPASRRDGPSLPVHLRSRYRRLNRIRAALSDSADAGAGDRFTLLRRIERVDALLVIVGASYFEALTARGGTT